MMPIVCEFPKVFLEDMIELPLEKELEFGIDLVLESSPVSTSQFHALPTEDEQSRGGSQ